MGNLRWFGLVSVALLMGVPEAAIAAVENVEELLEESLPSEVLIALSLEKAPRPPSLGERDLRLERLEASGSDDSGLSPVPPALGVRGPAERQTSLLNAKPIPAKATKLRPIAALKQAEPQALPLQIDGALTDDDPALDDDSRFDEHSFVGQAGQIVKITLSSDEFDAYLLVNGPDGERVAQNDNGPEGTDAQVVVRLPADGTYRALANAYDAEGRGAYQLAVDTATVAELQRSKRLAEVQQLFQQGLEQYNAQQWREAVQSYEAALAGYRELGDRADEANTLNNIGNVYGLLGNYPAAMESYEESLALKRELGNRAGEANTLGNIGNVYQSLGNYPAAMESYEESLALKRELGDRAGEANTLGNIGIVYRLLGNYPAAMESYEESLALMRELGDRAGEAITLGNIGNVYGLLGNYPAAMESYEESLALTRELGNRAGEANTLNNIGNVYQSLGNYPEALETYEESLALQRELGDRAGEAGTIGNIGNVYQLQGNYPEALKPYEESLALQRELGNRAGEANTLNNIGNVYGLLGNYPEALETYEESLALQRELGNRAGEAQTLGNIGKLLDTQQQPELAIVFLKQSINTYETIRTTNQTLDPALQETYTDTIEDDYRLLADLLLEQGRIFEAQQVIELLKVEEIRDFTRAVWRTDGLDYDPVEVPVVEAHGSLIALGADITTCDPTCDQDLYDRQTNLELAYDDTLERFNSIIATKREEDSAFYDPANLSSEARDLVDAQDGTVLIYPIVLEESLWLLWTATGGVVGSVEVTTTDQGDLSREVQRFRELLQKPDSESLAELKQVSQTLHSWLIEPLEAELKANNIQRLIFAQDRITRYLPMAALHDGENFLTESYTVSTVLSAGLTDTEERLGEVDAARTLGLGLDQGFPGYSALPNVNEELNAVVRDEEDGSDTGVYPGRVFMNGDFTFDTLSEQVRRYRILHIATHAEFRPKSRGESYILDGTGEELTISRIGSLDAQFRNLHLVVLSACQTALGGEALDGTEIAGVSSYFLGKNKAEAVMATLWRVDDHGTSLLMQRFYDLLATGKLTKAEALQQAQLSLLHGEDSLDDRLTSLGVPRGGFTLPEQSSTPANIDHPYYWAPFILIGNSL